MHLHVHLENHILFPRAAALVRDRTGQLTDAGGAVITLVRLPG